MTWQTEFRAWAVAIAAVFCLSSVGYKALTIPKIPDLAPTVAKANTTVDNLNTGLQALPGVLAHVQTASDAASKLLTAATGTVSAATPVVAGFQGTADKINTAIDLTSHRLDDLCPLPGAVDADIHPCGTLADANRTLATLRGTSGQVEISLLQFNKHEGDLFTQESAAYGGMRTAVTNFNSLVSPDSALRVTIGNLQTTTGDFAAISTDGRIWIHQKLYPTKKRGFVSGFEATGDAAKHWMPSIF